MRRSEVATNTGPEPQQMPQEVQQLLASTPVEAHLEVFRALAEPIRMEILRLLASAHGEEYPCTGLEQALPVTKSTISYHIKQLSGAGLITVRRDGRNFRYRLKEPTLNYFVPGLLERLRSGLLSQTADDATNA